MNSQNEQNGRPITLQSGASRDPRLRNIPTVEPRNDVCRDYVWGICTKHGQCKFRHECTIEEMKSIINFCHDYQNRTGCMLPNCTYLHTSKEEENLFRTKGQLPRVLLERHTAMNAAAVVAVNNNVQGVEGAPPPIFMTQPPPPPPPLATLPVPSVVPPPPPPPLTEPSAVAPIATSIYTAPPPPLATRVVPLMSQPPQPFPLFDASKPPPNLVNCAVKRTFNDNNFEVGTSKLRKTDEPPVADRMCEKCVQRELSNDLCLEELDKLNQQTEYKMFLYKSKSEEIENMKTMMRFLLPTEICLAVEEYIDGVQSQPFGMSVSMQLMMHRLLENRLTNSSNMIESVQSSSMRDLLMGYLLNSNSTSERLTSPEPRPNPILCAEISRSNTSNLPTTSSELSRLLNGHSVAQSQPEPPVTLHNRASQAYVDYGASVASGFSTTSAAYRSYHPIVPPLASTAAAYPSYPKAAPPAVYPPYQPTVPPPHARAAYAPSYGSTGSPTQAALPTAASCASAGSQTASAPAPLPTKSHSYGQYTTPSYQ